MSRKEFCEKDGILITYTDSDICFEDCMTAESVLLANDGTVIHSNFDAAKNEYFKAYLRQIYSCGGFNTPMLASGLFIIRLNFRRRIIYFPPVNQK